MLRANNKLKFSTFLGGCKSIRTFAKPNENFTNVSAFSSFNQTQISRYMQTNASTAIYRRFICTQNDSKRYLTTESPPAKLLLPIGKYYIRSEAPLQGYLQGKLCYIAEDAECESAKSPPAIPPPSFMATVTGTNDAGFMSFRSSLFEDEESYLAVRKKIENDEMSGKMLEEEGNFSGRLILSNIDSSLFFEQPSNLEETQFELFVPPNATNFANEEKEGVRALIKSVSNGRFISIKSGGNPFATEKDPALATVFCFERELRKQKSIIGNQKKQQDVPYSRNKMLSSKVSEKSLPPPGIYHIRVVQWASCIPGCFEHGYIVEDEYMRLNTSKIPSRKGLFRISHNNDDDGTISIFSLTINKYVCTDSRFGGLNFFDGSSNSETAKFELCQPVMPSTTGPVTLLVNNEFLKIAYDEGRCTCIYVEIHPVINYTSLDDYVLFEFLPVKP